MIVKVIYEKKGGHYHCAVFTGRAMNQTFAKSGDLVFRENEWADFQNQTTNFLFIERGKPRVVYVHAWEYVNPGPSAGGGGFDWYNTEGLARSAYDNAKPDADWAQFFFTFDVPETAGEVTPAIDAVLHELCASAATRKVGENVLAYWKTKKFKMGTATEPHRG